MRMTLRYLTPLIAAAGFASLAAAPIVSAQTNPTLPSCVGTGGAVAEGGSTTECATPGNVEINSTPSEPMDAYPWDDAFYGPALIFGVGGNGGGGHGGR
jgi:hypothetical protein